jgi:rSAM/selenodomain-associated transferase 1
MEKAFGIFAKQPRAGQVKTRLAQATSPEWAQRVAEAMLLDSLDRFQIVSADRSIIYAPDDANGYFKALAKGQYAIVRQSDGDLGARLEAFFTDCRGKGHSRIVAVGSDSPIVSTQFIEHAFDLLLTNDVVIGPALDGGYYLIGGGPHMPAIFRNIPWSTPQVLEKTLERIEQATSRVALLTPCWDVDTVDDWEMLRAYVFYMRRRGMDPGLCCIERLIMETTP